MIGWERDKRYKNLLLESRVKHEIVYTNFQLIKRALFTYTTCRKNKLKKIKSIKNLIYMKYKKK